MEKINIGTNTFVYPNPVTLLGANVEGRANFMPLGWVSRVNADPPFLGVGVNKVHHTLRGIFENKTFSVNFPRADMVEATDYCGLVSGKTTDKSKVFEIFYGELKTAPMITECSLSLECKLVDRVDLQTNIFFIGEIIASFTEEKYLTEGKLDIRKMNPLLLTMPDNCFWKVGDYVGKAWNIGNKFKKEKR
ncbi:MAG: flavin reductase family protein [Candidatus Methanoperedens sp.]|nr:flavin reductase family protein [Candidatus Methanoperedens sp.]MCZ7394233.1 flavin reductase family protein [Candidatus Methanoperedens sp.]